MKELKQNIIQIVESAGKDEQDFTQDQADQITQKVFGLFRLRLHEPFFISIYYPIRSIGEYLAETKKPTGEKISNLIQDAISNESRIFQELGKVGIQIASPVTPKELNFIEGLSSLSAEDRKRTISEFLDLS